MRVINTLSSQAACRTIGRVHEIGLGAFPREVRIETTNACNAKCTICCHACMKRPLRRMDDGLFTQIIDECAASGCGNVHLHNFGEPLMDRTIEDRVRYAKHQGLPKVKIFSNGSLVSRERARGLIDAGLDEIKISFDGSTREEFERIRTPLKFDTVVQNIRDLVATRDAMGSSMKIKLACCTTSDKSTTIELLEDMVDGFSFSRVHNWASGTSKAEGAVRRPCSRVWRTFTILANGDVSLCCLDYEGEVKLGHIDANTSIRDIFHGAAYREIRRKHREGRQSEISLCNHCTKAFL